ncbi:MAG: hypothetical protein O7E53_01695 [Alphaproteobacteria bacterium]|nr:hypothetical protein [Alphaproteobacteria bacterium]MCZ6885058.1 hypothetical protein [Alphaproteobacteria bacterium]
MKKKTTIVLGVSVCLLIGLGAVYNFMLRAQAIERAAPVFNDAANRCSISEGIPQKVGCLLAEGTKAMDHDNRLATKLLLLGIKTLGDSYRNENYVDDTGQKLVLAKIKHDEGEFVASAHLYQSVLKSRLIMLDALRR